MGFHFFIFIEQLKKSILEKMGDKPPVNAADLKKDGLKHVDTKEGGGPSDSDLKAMAAVYTKHKGDKGKIAKELGVEFKDSATFKDANDFAKQLLSGLCIK